MFQSRITFAVEAEVGVILAFNEPESSLVPIATPWLNRERLVEIIVMPLLLV